MPLSMLTEMSDAVVVARVAQASVAKDRFMVAVEVVRSLKGRVQRGTLLTIDALESNSRPELMKPIANDIGIFFLRRKPGG